MKVSDFLRQYQITGKVPDDADDPMIAFWAGWLMGRVQVRDSIEGALDMAIHAAEFIEVHAR